MQRSVIILVLVTHSSLSLGCQCARTFRSNFLSQVKGFDVIVLGTFHTDGQSRATLDVEKVYKGQIDTRSIALIRGGLDCYNMLLFEDGQKIILGLNKSPFVGQSDGFVAQGCITSSIYVNKDEVKTGGETKTLPAIGRQRIGFISRTMKLRRIEKKLERRT